jgi:putative peptidoglycan lipid II flippase
MSASIESNAPLPPPNALSRAFAMLKPSHRHTAFTATLLLMLSALASRVIGLVRTKYIAYLFGAHAQADAFNAAFQLPDMISYFLVGGAASITFVTILTRYRDTGREADGERAMSVILTTMVCILGAAIVAAEFLAPAYVATFLKGFQSDPSKAALCVQLTRILLPAQLFFLAGGVFGSILLVRKQFNIQAVTPLIYNCGTIFGGVLLYRYFGPPSLAIGTVAGAFCGPFLLNAIGAHRAGMRYKPILDWSNPGLHEWVRMSIPLMLGVSLVSADNWIINYFASHNSGDVSLLTYAKSLFAAPVSLGQAAGAASLPFLASLFTKSQSDQSAKSNAFSDAVNASVSRIAAFSILLTSLMVAMAGPSVDLVFRGGRFGAVEAGHMAIFFAIFSFSLCFWSAQAIYARAFYATGNTVTPLVASTIVTAVALFIYKLLYASSGPIGLAIASDIGIVIQTMTLAVLLHRRRLVALTGLDYTELARALVASIVSYAGLALLHRSWHAHGRLNELLLLIVASIVWLMISAAVLLATGSSLPGQLTARFRRQKADPSS